MASKDEKAAASDEIVNAGETRITSCPSRSTTVRLQSSSAETIESKSSFNLDQLHRPATNEASERAEFTP